MSMVRDYFRNRNVPQLTGRAVLQFTDRERLVSMEEQLRTIPVVERPSDEYAPQRMDYSIERAESFLSSHLEEIAMARATLLVEVSAAETHLAELQRQVSVTTIVHDALAETLTKLTGRALDIQEQSEGFPS